MIILGMGLRPDYDNIFSQHLLVWCFPKIQETQKTAQRYLTYVICMTSGRSPAATNILISQTVLVLQQCLYVHACSYEGLSKGPSLSKHSIPSLDSRKLPNLLFFSNSPALIYLVISWSLDSTITPLKLWDCIKSEDPQLQQQVLLA